LVGAVVIASWSYGLIRDSAMVLLDADADPGLSDEIRGFWKANSRPVFPTCICGGLDRAIAG